MDMDKKKKEREREKERKREREKERHFLVTYMIKCNFIIHEYINFVYIKTDDYCNTVNV
jgi:hypothetical protein